MIKHSITHYHQPTNHSCSQASMAMMLSFFGDELSLEEVMARVPVNKGDDGEEWGSINQQLATWCLSRGFEVDLYTADFEIIDLSWAELSTKEIISRMELAKEKRDIPALGKQWSKMYMQSYIDFVQAGGRLHIEPYMTTKLLDTLLIDSPLLACVCLNVFYSEGRGNDSALRQSRLDDLDGKLANHSIVLYGKDDDGNYLVADPWKEPGTFAIEPEHLLAAMAAAQIECDNLLFQLKRKE